jgi:hypothetical protein
MTLSFVDTVVTDFVVSQSETVDLARIALGSEIED